MKKNDETSERVINRANRWIEQIAALISNSSINTHLNSFFLLIFGGFYV